MTLQKLGTDPSAPLASILGMEYHHPILRMLGGHGVRIERENMSIHIMAGGYKSYMDLERNDDPNCNKIFSVLTCYQSS